MREYISRTNDYEFLDTLSLYFQNQDTHPLRFKFYRFKAKFLLKELEQGYREEDEASRLLALNQLKIDAEYILQNFPEQNP